MVVAYCRRGCMYLHLWKRWISFSYFSLHRWHCGL